MTKVIVIQPTFGTEEMNGYCFDVIVFVIVQDDEETELAQEAYLRKMYPLATIVFERQEY